MAREWRESTVANEVDILLGFAFGSSEFATEPPGHRLVRGDNVKRGAIEWGEKSRYWRKVTPDLDKYILQTDDIVVGMDGSRVGENFARISSEDLPALLVQRVACLRSKGALDQAYLRYVICNSHFTAYIKAVHTGTSIPHISGKQIGTYQIWVPSRPEQRAIAHVLGTLDAKIELNRRTNETLEAIGRAIFKSWFIDFDVVRAKVQRRESLLPRDITNLFASSLEDSSLGQIPKGWRIGKVADLCDAIYSGGTPSTQVADYWNGNVRWLSSGETRDKIIVNTEKRITSAGVSNSSTRAASARSTVIASAGQGNTRGQTSLLGIDCYVNQSVIVLSANRRTCSPSYLFFDLERRYDQFRQISDGHSSRGSLTTKLLAGLDVVIPPLPVIERFEAAIAPTIETAIVNLNESNTLTALREALLPKLISGELRLNPREKFDHTKERRNLAALSRI